MRLSTGILRYFPTFGQGIQEWTNQNLHKTAFKKFEVMWSA